jgi:hypothetical protein
MMAMMFGSLYMISRQGEVSFFVLSMAIVAFLTGFACGASFFLLFSRWLEARIQGRPAKSREHPNQR